MYVKMGSAFRDIGSWFWTISLVIAISLGAAFVLLVAYLAVTAR